MGNDSGDVVGLRALARGQHEIHRQHDLARDDQRFTFGEFVERDADLAADRVLQRHEGRVGIAGAHRVECLGHTAHRGTYSALGRRDGPQCLFGERTLGPEEDEPCRWHTWHAHSVRPGHRTEPGNQERRSRAVTARTVRRDARSDGAEERQ
jgi:hypothetical protein